MLGTRSFGERPNLPRFCEGHSGAKTKIAIVSSGPLSLFAAYMHTVGGSLSTLCRSLGNKMLLKSRKRVV